MPILGHLLRVTDKGGVKQKNKHHETIFPLTENKEVQFKEPHLALGIPKSHPWHGMDIFRNPPIKKKQVKGIPNYKSTDTASRRPKNEPLPMATTPQGALLLLQGRNVHLFQPLHTPKGHCFGVGWERHKALRITSGALNCWD